MAEHLIQEIDEGKYFSGFTLVVKLILQENTASWRRFPVSITEESTCIIIDNQV